MSASYDHTDGTALLLRVEQLLDGHAGSKRSIAALLLTEGSGITQLSMAEVAHLSYTSKPSLVRFAQSLGFAGWLDFQHAFVAAARAHEARERERFSIDPNFPFTEDTSAAELAESISTLELRAQQHIQASLDEKALTYAGQRVSKAQQVVVFAIAQNRYLGMNLAYRLKQINISCTVPQPQDLKQAAQKLGPHDCAVLVSYSGMGIKRPPASLVPILLKRQVPCVAITNLGNNWLRHHIDCVLSFPPEEHLYSKIAGYYSEAATSFMLDLLYSICFQLHYSKNLQLKLDAVVSSEQQMQTPDVLPGS